MAVFDFDPSELEGIAPSSAQEVYLRKFGFVEPPLPSGFSHRGGGGGGGGGGRGIEGGGEGGRLTPPPSPGRDTSRLPLGGGGGSANVNVQDGGFGGVGGGGVGAGGGGEVVNKLVAKRNHKNKKRVPLSGVGSAYPDVPSASNSNLPTLHHNQPAQAQSRSNGSGRTFHEIAGIIPSRSDTFGSGRGRAASGGYGDVDREYEYEYDGDMSLAYDHGGGEDGEGDVSMSMSTEVGISSFGGGGEGKDERGGGGSGGGGGKARTLGGDRVVEREREGVDVREIQVGYPGGRGVGGVGEGVGVGGIEGRVPRPKVLTYLKAVSSEGGNDNDMFEGRNYDDGCKSSFLLPFLSTLPSNTH